MVVGIAPLSPSYQLLGIWGGYTDQNNALSERAFEGTAAPL
jgi:hypothetical protein